MFAYLTEIVQANVLSLYVNEPDEVFTCTKHNCYASKVEIRNQQSLGLLDSLWKNDGLSNLS